MAVPEQMPGRPAEDGKIENAPQNGADRAEIDEKVDEQIMEVKPASAGDVKLEPYLFGFRRSGHPKRVVANTDDRVFHSRLDAFGP